MKPNGTEAGTMAKAQKTVMIPEELYRIFADQEKRTGITFSRQALAAFCAYFFTERTGPDPVWVEAIVAYENGTLSIEVPIWNVVGIAVGIVIIIGSVIFFFIRRRIKKAVS